MRHGFFNGLVIVCMVFLAGCQSRQAPKDVFYQPQAVQQGQPRYANNGQFQNGKPSQFPGDVQSYAGQQTTMAGILLPLSGQSQALGKAMLDGATLAVFESNNPGFTLTPYDTGSSDAGAQTAARKALADGAKILIGPIFASNVRAVKTVAQPQNVPVLSFSNDRTIGGNGVYLMGYQPQTQVDRVLQHATSNGLNRIGILAPDSPFGMQVVQAAQNAVKNLGAKIIAIQYFKADGSNINDAAKAIGRLAAGADSSVAEDQTYQALLLPAAGAQLRTIAALLPYFNVSSQRVKLLGVSSWYDRSLLADNYLQGSWFAGASPLQKDAFRNKYMAAFARQPQALESLAYDATALAATLAKTGTEAFSTTQLNNPNGFGGVEGIFRFRNDGSADRGLAVIEIRGNTFYEVNPPPSVFTTAQY